MSKVIITALTATALAVAAFAATDGTITKLPQSGDVVQIGDFKYVVLSKSDFDRMCLTVNDLSAKYKAMCSNETGRVALHGARGHRTITNGVIVVEYADGYRHIEPVKGSAIKPMNRPASTVPTFKPRPMPNAKIRAARKAALARTNEVTEVVK